MKLPVGCFALLLVVNSYECTTSPTSPTRAKLLGTWGGDHLSLQIESTGAKLEYDCAMGTITEPIVLDGRGRFDVRGFHTPGHGGPIREGEVSPRYPARYVGQGDGSRMTLVVSLVDSAAVIGSFMLERGRTGSVFRCL